MAGTLIRRCLRLSSTIPLSTRPSHYFHRPLSSEPANRHNPKLVNFSLPDSDSETDDSPVESINNGKTNKTQLPPLYNPFAKSKNGVSEPQHDPKDLQKIFHDMRGDGMFNYAVKMFDELSKHGLAHEALELFSQIKDKGQMPDVVAHTAVIEAYANAGGHSKEALKVFLRMLASGVQPNVHTYSVLIKGLAGDGKFREVEKYVMEMMQKGMKPNGRTYTAVFEAFAREDKAKEGKELLAKMKTLGFVADENDVREVLNNKRGPVFRNVINILFDK